jgi:protein PhnA
VTNQYGCLHPKEGRIGQKDSRFGKYFQGKRRVQIPASCVRILSISCRVHPGDSVSTINGTINRWHTYRASAKLIQLPHCPECASEYNFQDGGMLVCPSCAHEWSVIKRVEVANDDALIVRDSNENALKDDNTVVVIKDLKVWAASSAIRVGTKVRDIRLVDPNNFAGHDIDCKIDGFGAMQLKSEFVKKE